MDGAVRKGNEATSSYCSEEQCELEAAEALAGLAHTVVGGGESEPDAVRVKTESPVDESVSRSSYVPPQDRNSMVLEQPEETSIEKAAPVKTEQDIEHESNLACTRNHPSTKSRHNLTAEEKEERRMRRVLANRESARQTIRRRQAMYDELTRKAADLALQNESLKKEKELAVKEYDSLTSKNVILKAEMARVAKAEAEKKSREAQAATSSCNPPIFIYNQLSVSPFPWPSVVQPLDGFHFQCAAQNASKVPQSSSGSFREPEGAPYYVVPFPWFFPCHSHDRPSNNPDEGPSETSMDHCHSMSSSTSFENHRSLLHGMVKEESSSSPNPSLNSMFQVENHRSLLPVTVKTEASSSVNSLSLDNLNETRFGLPPEGLALTLMHDPKSFPASSASTSLVDTPVHDERDNEAVRSPVRLREPTDHGVDAATEARKRRKELMRLKSLRYHQHHIYC